MTTEGISPGQPQILDMPSQKMAAVYTRGAPEQAIPRVLPTLYNSVYALKFDRSITGGGQFDIGSIRARFPDAHLAPAEEWTTVIGVPVPDDITALPQQVGGIEVKVETWEYGTVAQVSRRENAAPDAAAVEGLLRYIEENGYEIIGVHEEEYLSHPSTGELHTVTRYRVRRK